MNNFEILKFLEQIEADTAKQVNYGKRVVTNCSKRVVVAILFRNDKPVSIGHNTVVLPTVPEVCKKCVKHEYKIRPTCPAIHAEISCLANYADWDANCKYSLAISYSPCPECCKLIRTLPIAKVYVKTPRLKELPEADKMTYNVNNYDELAKLLLTTDSIRTYEVL